MLAYQKHYMQRSRKSLKYIIVMWPFNSVTGNLSRRRSPGLKKHLTWDVILSKTVSPGDQNYIINCYLPMLINFNQLKCKGSTNNNREHKHEWVHPIADCCHIIQNRICYSFEIWNKISSPNKKLKYACIHTESKCW